MASDSLTLMTSATFFVVFFLFFVFCFYQKRQKRSFSFLFSFCFVLAFLSLDTAYCTTKLQLFFTKNDTGHEHLTSRAGSLGEASSKQIPAVLEVKNSCHKI